MQTFYISVAIADNIFGREYTVYMFLIVLWSNKNLLTSLKLNFC